MNFGLKSKTFNVIGSGIVSPGQPIQTVLEAGARIVGVLLTSPTAPNGGTVADTASFALFATAAGINNVLANGNHTFVAVTFPGSSIGWWAGITGQYKDDIVQQSGPANNTVQGFFPLCPPPKWTDGVNAYDLYLQVVWTGLGTVIVFYTLDPPTASGERA